MKELSQTDSQSLLNPIIDTVGIVSSDMKNKLTIQLTALLNRIIVEQTKDTMQGMNGLISKLVEKVERLSVAMSERITELEQKMTRFEGDSSELLSKLTDEIISLRESGPTNYSVKPKGVSMNQLYTQESLSQLGFSDLVKIANKLKVEVVPRLKKVELIDLILRSQNDGK